MSNQLVLVGDKQNLKSFLEEPQFLESLRSVASKFLTPERVAKIALLAASRQPDLYKCTKISFLQAIIRATECGLEFGGVTGQGYLVPYRNGYPPSVLAEQLRAAGREGAMEILEAMLDRGDLKLDAIFDPRTHDIVSFGLALYESGLRKYVIVAEEVGAQEGDGTGEFDEDDEDHATGGFDDE